MDFAIIAAGQGSRLKMEGQDLPKPLVRLGGKPMIGRLIEVLSLAGARTIYIIVNEEMSEVADYLRSLTPADCELRLTVRTTSGSMESFRELARSMDRRQPFCLLTVDSVFLPDEFEKFIAEFEADKEADGYMAVTSYVADEKPLYVAAGPDGEITGFLDRPLHDTHYVSGGIYALRPEAFSLLDDCAAAGKTRMRDFQRSLVAAGLRLKARPFSKIIDADHVSDLREAEIFLSENQSNLKRYNG